MGLFEFRFPELGEGLHEGRIDHWTVKVGDTVKEDDTLAEVENDKAMVELPSPVDGKVASILVSDGTTVTVGDLIITLEVEGEGNASGTAAQAPVGEPGLMHVATIPTQAEPLPTPASPTPVTPSAAPQSPVATEVLATPGVRKFAREHGVVLTNVRATGSNGKITQQDVEAYLQGGQSTVTSPVATPIETPVTTTDSDVATANATTNSTSVVAKEEDETRVPLTSIRRVIAQAMVKSAYTAPHVTIMDEVVVDELVALRSEIKPFAEKRELKITYLPFIVKALVAACKKFPHLNASFDDEKQEIVVKNNYHIGIATDTERGLVVPVIRDADRKNMWEIAGSIQDLATKARTNKLSVPEMKGSTISITNIGSAGGMFFTPIINYPEVAILGVGRITPKPIIKDGEVVPGQVMALSLSFDHRIIDGAMAQNFVNEIKAMLENPRLLLMGV